MLSAISTQTVSQWPTESVGVTAYFRFFDNRPISISEHSKKLPEQIQSLCGVGAVFQFTAQSSKLLCNLAKARHWHGHGCGESWAEAPMMVPWKIDFVRYPTFLTRIRPLTKEFGRVSGFKRSSEASLIIGRFRQSGIARSVRLSGVEVNNGIGV